MKVIERLAAAEDRLAARDAAGLGRILRQAFPDDPDLPVIDGLIGLALEPDGVTPALSGVGRLFAAGIDSARKRWFDPDRAFPGPAVTRRIAGTEFDVLGERREVAEWSVAQALNYLVLRAVVPAKRAAVVGTMRDDGIYALEWIAHYQALGFEQLVLYTNDNADGSEHLLRRLADHGVIILVESHTQGLVRPEVKAFDHAVHFVHEVRDCEWVLFVDSDELFVPAPRYRNRIANVLDDIERLPLSERPAAVLYEWLWFNSGMVFARRPGLLQDRFRFASPHWLTKPLARLRDVLTMRLQHVPELYGSGRIVNSRFRPIDLDQVWEPHDPDYGGGRLNHYWPKSFQEFSLKKARGDALPLEDDEYRRAFSLFFQWNAPETPDTFCPPDPEFLEEVQRRCRALRALDGVAETEAEVERRFAKLLERYDAEGGLAHIYASLRNTTESGLKATL